MSVMSELDAMRQDHGYPIESWGSLIYITHQPPGQSLPTVLAMCENEDEALALLGVYVLLDPEGAVCGDYTILGGDGIVAPPPNETLARLGVYVLLDPEGAVREEARVATPPPNWFGPFPAVGTAH